MAERHLEKMLLEAFNGALSLKARLGVVEPGDKKEMEHTSQFRFESLRDAFALKVSKSPFFESLTSAFYNVHSYKYIDNPTFKVALETELKSRAVPSVEIQMAKDAVDSIIESLTAKMPSERDAGWNPALDEITDMTRNADTRKLERPKPFFGGGPWAEDYDKKFLDSLIHENVLTHKEANTPKAKEITTKFSSLRGMQWSIVKPDVIALIDDARQIGFSGLVNYMEDYVTENDIGQIERQVLKS